AIAQRRFGDGDIDELGLPGRPAGTSGQRQKARGDEQQYPPEQSDYSVGSPYNVGIAHWFANKYSSPRGAVTVTPKAEFGQWGFGNWAFGQQTSPRRKNS